MSERFRKKPVVIDAMQFDGANSDAIVAWVGESARAMLTCYDDGREPLQWVEIRTLEGRMQALPNDWIIRGVKGEFYPCKPEIFAATYEAAALPGRAQASPDFKKLIARWRTKADQNGAIYASGIHECADDLEKLLASADAAVQEPSPQKGDELIHCADCDVEIRRRAAWRTLGRTICANCAVQYTKPAAPLPATEPPK